VFSFKSWLAETVPATPLDPALFDELANIIL